MALRNARDLYTRRGEGRLDLGGAGRRHRRRRAPTRRTPSSTRPPTRSTGTRRSTTSRRGSSTCDEPATLRLHARPRRRRAGRLPSGWAGGSAARPSSRRTSRSPTSRSTSSARPGTLLTYAGEARGRGPHRGRPRLPARRPRLPQRPAGRAADDRLRRRDGAAAGGLDLPVPALRRRCQGCADATLAAIAGKAVKEVAYHRRPRLPLGRCGSATAPTSPTAGCRQALDAEWPYVDELFEPLAPALAGRVVDPAALRGAVRTDLTRVVAQATLTVPDVPPALGGGRQGLHTEHLGHLLAEMQHLHRSHPGATW